VAIKIAREGVVPNNLTLEEHVIPPLPPLEDTSSGPDTVPPPPQETPSELAWSQLEATGETLSKGKTPQKAISQTDSYIFYLLQARPDLISVTGIFDHPEARTFRLFFRDAWGGPLYRER
jgi:hypothetical protein